jgi:hypothetical protein
MSVNTLRISILIFIISLSTSDIALAQKIDSTKQIRVIPLPSVFYTPETSWGFGATVLGFYTPKDTFTRKSNAQVFFDVTLMGQA